MRRGLRALPTRRWPRPTGRTCPLLAVAESGRAATAASNPATMRAMDASAWHASEARERVRRGEWTAPTAGVAVAHAQANLVCLPREHASDFLLYCVRNPRPCPLLEVLDAGRFEPECAPVADLGTDLPGERVLRVLQPVAGLRRLRNVWPD